MVSLRTLMILCICGILFGAGCDDPDGGSFSNQPLADEPAILDGALAINVTENRPDGIADFFFDDTERIYLWLYWINVPGTHTVEVQWFSPTSELDEPAVRSTEPITSSSGKAITTFFIDQPAGGFEVGEWFVEIYLDGFFERSYLFQVK